TVITKRLLDKNMLACIDSIHQVLGMEFAGGCYNDGIAVFDYRCAKIYSGVKRIICKNIVPQFDNIIIMSLAYRAVSKNANLHGKVSNGQPSLISLHKTHNAVSSSGLILLTSE